MRFKRPCRKCDKIFLPKGKQTRLCPECRSEANSRRWPKK